jgi:hypothetical protein
MRVAGGNRALTSDDYTLPSDKVKKMEEVEAAIQQSMHEYKRLLEYGETPQVARAAMPTSRFNVVRSKVIGDYILGFIRKCRRYALLKTHHVSLSFCMFTDV